MRNLIFFLIIPGIVIVASIIAGLFSRERNKRKTAEKELHATKKSLKELCEVCIKEHNSVNAKITYEAYFGRYN